MRFFHNRKTIFSPKKNFKNFLNFHLQFVFEFCVLEFSVLYSSQWSFRLHLELVLMSTLLVSVSVSTLPPVLVYLLSKKVIFLKIRLKNWKIQVLTKNNFWFMVKFDRSLGIRWWILYPTLCRIICRRWPFNLISR